MSNVAAAPATAPETDLVVGSLSLEIRDTAINVDEIMARIRRSIQEKRKSRAFRQDALLAQSIDILQLSQGDRSIADHLALLKYAARIDLEGEQITSHRPLAGFFIKMVKRLTRTWVRKYTDSIFTKQNHFNAELITVLSDLHQQVQDLRTENERLREELRPRE